MPNYKVNVLANVQSDNKSGSVGEKSLKSQRTYQVGVVYKDIYGRETPVFTSGKSSFTVLKNTSDKKNSIVAKLQSQMPDWVDTYKFFVKETSNEYYNACMDRWYDAEDDNLWLSFPSAERNKIKEDGFIILKKQAASDNAVHEEARYKVIDIQNEAPDFIKTDYELYGTDTLKVMANGALPGSKTIKFEFDDSAATDWKDESVFYDALLAANTSNPSTSTGFIGWPIENVAIKLQDSNGTNTGWLDVANIYLDGNIFVELSKPLLGESDSSNNITVNSAISNIIPIPGSAASVVVKFAKKVVKNKTEFDGKFFVKIARDSVLDQKVREVGNVSANFSVTNQIDQYHFVNTSSASNETFWGNVGERWFIDEASRADVGSFGSGLYGPFDRDNGFGILGNGPGKRENDEQPYLQCTMELTLNRIKDGDKDGYNVGNNLQSNQDFLNKMSQQGTLFRWQEDPFQHVYRVVGIPGDSRNENATEGPPDKSWKRGILNYSSSKSARKDKKNKSIRLYLKFVTTGWRLNDDQVNNGIYEFFEDEEGKYPFSFNSSYTPPLATVGTDNWNPTKRGYGEYAAATGTADYANSITAGAWRSISQGTTTPFVGNNPSAAAAAGYHNTLQILKIEPGDKEPTVTKEPAVWETEPREDVGLDIYYEASQAYPARLTNQTNELFAPYGSTVTSIDKISNGLEDQFFSIPDNTTLYDWAPTGHGGDTILLNIRTNEIGYVQQQLLPTVGTPITILGNFTLLQNLIGIELRFTRADGSYTTAKVKYISGWFPGTQPSPPTSPVTYITQPNYFINPSGYIGNSTDRVLIKLDRDLSTMNIKLPYFNCYSFGNGVESDRIRDDFNAVTIGKGVKASTVLPELYKEEQRTNGLIYSGIYNSNSSVNNLNQFIAAEKITKDVPPTYGSIQKLKARDTNLVAFCEDKILKIVAYKDALYSADGKPQLIASNNVLGDISSFAGEFGISKNPESYAEDSFRMYCTDKQRGKVLRISGDGVTPISDVGMEDYFADNLKNSNTLIGSFDDRKQEYNLTLKDQTLSFSETAKGWTSFKSFIPESGLSINNNYYTLKNGELWEHHVNEIRNNFYGDDYNSYVDVLFNEQSEKVKSFASMKYEGTQSKITENLGHTDANGVFYPDNEYYNNIGKPGWYVESGITDLQEAGEMEFKKKEGKYFSYMKGKPVTGANDLNSKEFSFQGIDLLQSIVDNGEGQSNEGGGTVILGCTDPSATNYNPAATVDDGSCVIPTYGCTDPNAINYLPGATADDGSCVVCSSLQINFDVDPHPMLHLSNGIRVISYLNTDDLPYTVACTNSSGALIGDSAGSFGWTAGSSMNGDVVFFGQGTPLPTDTYTITITTAHGCTSQETILLDNGAPPTPTSFRITVQDTGDQDPGTNI